MSMQRIQVIDRLPYPIKLTWKFFSDKERFEFVANFQVEFF
jgi:hypothetical protein